MNKIDIISGAYTEIRVSGITSNPKPSELEWALDKLESMASEWSENRNICTGYNFEDDPDPNSESGLTRRFKHGFETNLAIRLLASFGKQAPPTLMAQASQSLSAIAESMSPVRETQQPERMPVGSGNSLRYNRWRRFYRKVPLAPQECETQNITQTAINDYSLNINDYLDDGETVSSYTFESSAGLTISTESLADGTWSYRVEASASASKLQRVRLDVVTDAGREQPFIINFNVDILPD